MAFNDEEGLNGLRLTQCKLHNFNRSYHLSKAAIPETAGE